MNGPTDPTDPISALTAEAALHHEIYLAYVGAGFTEQQALDPVKAIVTATIRGPQ